MFETSQYLTVVNFTSKVSVNFAGFGIDIVIWGCMDNI